MTQVKPKYDNGPFITLRECAELAGISSNQWRKMVKSKTGPKGCILWRKSDVIAWVNMVKLAQKTIDTTTNEAIIQGA